MSPDFRKALLGLSGRAAQPDGAPPSIGAGTPADPGVDPGNGTAAITSVAPVSPSPSQPSSPAPEPSPSSAQVVPSASTLARNGTNGSNGYSSDHEAVTEASTAPLQAAATPASNGSLPTTIGGSAAPDSILDLRAQAQAILSDVIADLVRESKLEPIEEAEQKRLTREQEYARLLEEGHESKPTSLLDHAFDPSGSWGHEGDEVNRSMRRGPKMRERRGRGRLY